MTRSSRLSLGQAALFVTGLTTLAFTGLPGLTVDGGPVGEVAGFVRTADGAPVGGVLVALFHGEALAFVESTKTDAEGRFAFDRAPWSFHLFARPEAETGLFGAWALDRPGALQQEVSIELLPGVPVEVEALDVHGEPLAFAEVRAYAPDGERGAGHGGEDTHVVVRTLTDEAGRASLVVPPRTHLAVLALDRDVLAEWRFEIEPQAGESFRFVLPDGKPIRGRVTDPDDVPLDSILVSSWDERSPGDWQWNGYERTGADGSFETIGPLDDEGTAILRVIDPQGGFLAETLALEPLRTDEDLHLRLSQGESVGIRVAGRENEALKARVWLFSEATQSWSWGKRTDAEGHLKASFSGPLEVVARPLDGSATDFDLRPTPDGVELRATDR